VWLLLLSQLVLVGNTQGQSRFDEILQQFGFRGAGSENVVRASLSPSIQQEVKSPVRSEDVVRSPARIQTSKQSRTDDRLRSQPDDILTNQIPRQGRNAAIDSKNNALAALFSVAKGEHTKKAPKVTSPPQSNQRVQSSRPSRTKDNNKQEKKSFRGRGSIPQGRKVNTSKASQTGGDRPRGNNIGRGNRIQSGGSKSNNAKKTIITQHSKQITPSASPAPSPSRGRGRGRGRPASTNQNSPSPSQRPNTPSQRPSSPSQRPSSPSQRPSSPSQRPSSPRIKPPSPSQRPASPSRRPSPSQVPSSPSRRPSSPSQIPDDPIQRLASLSQRPGSPSRRPSSPNQLPSSPSRKPTSSSQTPASPSRRPPSPSQRPKASNVNPAASSQRSSNQEQIKSQFSDSLSQFGFKPKLLSNSPFSQSNTGNSGEAAVKSQTRPLSTQSGIRIVTPDQIQRRPAPTPSGPSPVLPTPSRPNQISPTPSQPTIQGSTPTRLSLPKSSLSQSRPQTPPPPSPTPPRASPSLPNSFRSSQAQPSASPSSSRGSPSRGRGRGRGRRPPTGGRGASPTASPNRSGSLPTAPNAIPTANRVQAQQAAATPARSATNKNSALGILESIAAGEKPSTNLVIKNRGRGGQTRPSTQSQTQTQTQTQSVTSPRNSQKSSDNFLINPFVHPQLQAKNEAPSPSRTATEQKVSKPSFQSSSNQAARAGVPVSRGRENTLTQVEEQPRAASLVNEASRGRQGSTRPSIFIPREPTEVELIDAREVEDRKAERQNEIEERRKQKFKNKFKKDNDRPHKKKFKKEYEEKKIKEQRPPVIPGCFRICDTLIFEVYQILGGNVCECTV